MIAERKIMRVSSQKIEVDLGDNYKSFLNRDVEIVIFPCMEHNASESEKELAWGAMRGSIRSIAADFDDANVSDWEACQ
ncbi:MAG: hypothetical protein EOL87_18395 [Spartobacteria bacterium]|nr:hypothetical protein [Spartobacteria bacterium]